MAKLKTPRDSFIAHWKHSLGLEGAEKAWEEKMRHEYRAAPGLITDIQPWDAYVSPASGKVITSNKQRREDMLRTNSRPWEGMTAEKQEADRRKQYIEQKQDAKLHESVSRAFYQLDPRKRRELSRG